MDTVMVLILDRDVVVEMITLNMTREVGFFFFQAEDGIRDIGVTGVQTCALPICRSCARCRGNSPGCRRSPGRWLSPAPRQPRSHTYRACRRAPRFRSRFATP